MTKKAPKVKAALKTTAKAKGTLSASQPSKPTVKFDFDNFKSTAEIPVPESIADQIIGQERGVSIIKKAASQKRNVLLIGTPGTGKSMLAQAMAELMPVQEMEDVLAYANPEDENAPIIKIVKAGEGRKIVAEGRFKSRMVGGQANMITMVVVLLLSFFLLFYARKELGDVITAAMLIGLFVLTAAMAFAAQVGRNKLIPGGEQETAKLLVDNSGKKKAPYIDATGARAGSLLGDIRHDPLQSLIDDTKLLVKNGRKWKAISFGQFWKRVAKKYPKLVEKHPNNYEAVVLPKGERVYALGYKNGRVVASRIYSLNRYFAEKETVQLTAPSINLTLTSDHKLITPRGSKPAHKNKVGQQLITLS